MVLLYSLLDLLDLKFQSLYLWWLIRANFTIGLLFILFLRWRLLKCFQFLNQSRILRLDRCILLIFLRYLFGEILQGLIKQSHIGLSLNNSFSVVIILFLQTLNLLSKLIVALLQAFNQLTFLVSFQSQIIKLLLEGWELVTVFWNILLFWFHFKLFWINNVLWGMGFRV